jgi:hypothetical protein
MKREDIQTELNLIKATNIKIEKEKNQLGLQISRKDQQLVMLEQEKFDAVQDKEAAKSAVSALTREVEWLRRQTDNEKSDIMKLVRDRDVIKRTLHQVTETNIKNRNEIIQKDQTIATTLDQNEKYKTNVKELLKSVKDISKERDTHQKQAQKNQA